MDRISEIIRILQKIYRVKISKEDPFRVLIRVMLSHRTLDKTSIPAAERLFSRADTPEKILKLSKKEIEKIIYPVGFYKMKSKNILKTCAMLVGKFSREVPHTMEELIQFPGVGVKSAAIVLVWGYGIPAVAVDSHVNRVMQRIGIVEKDSRPAKTQGVLEKIIPENLKPISNFLFVQFGREICQPRIPLCYKCPIVKLCEYEPKNLEQKKIIPLRIYS